MKIATLLVTILLAGTLLTGCGKPSAPPNSNPLITGTLTQIGEGSIMVEEDPSKPAGGAKCGLEVTEKTGIFKGTAAVSTADLAEGQKIRAWADGAVQQSYPCRAKAKAILIVE